MSLLLSLSDLAALFECCLGISNYVTAITFVDLGTSLTYTLASKTVVADDEYADASIGNVTGAKKLNTEPFWNVGKGFYWYDVLGYNS